MFPSTPVSIYKDYYFIPENRLIFPRYNNVKIIQITEYRWLVVYSVYSLTPSKAKIRVNYFSNASFNISNNLRLIVVPSASYKIMHRKRYNMAVACALHDIFTGNKRTYRIHKRSNNVKLVKIFCMTTQRK